MSARLRTIDALRGLAALTVVVYHAAPLFAVKLSPAVGTAGVLLFFVISGFCIHLRTVQTETVPEFWSFWKRRFRRLYPPYLVALLLFIVVEFAEGKIKLNGFFVYDLILHLVMLHNFDSRTVYSLNGVFWTLAIEEQLYLAYFGLLWMRNRWGWTRTLLVTALARLLWFGVALAAHRLSGAEWPVVEAAMSQWMVWALGALAVEAFFGRVTLPPWCSSLRLCFAFASLAAVATFVNQGDYPRWVKNAAWLINQPLWGVSAFVLLNWFVSREKHCGQVAFILARVGVFSYSLYLIHELVLAHSPRFAPALLCGALGVSLSLMIAWLYFCLVERPFLNRSRQEPASA